jgi:hypothetical protein
MFPMPIPESVRDLLSKLVGRPVTTTRTEPPEDLLVGHGGLLADYVSDDGTLAAVCAVEVSLAAALGAALTLVPVLMVEEAVKVGRLHELSLAENFAEIMNVMARLFNSNDTPHVRWRDVYDDQEGSIPDDVVALVKQPNARRALNVDVEGYGSGSLILLVR